jgi:hypothetical protein
MTASCPRLTASQLLLTESISQSYFTTRGFPPISSSWRQAPWDSRPDFFHLNTCGHTPYVTSSLTRGWVCRLQLLLVLASIFILRSESRGTHDHILLPQIWDFPNLEGQVHVFISPGNRVARFYPQALGSLSIAFYDSHGYGGGIRTRLHTGLGVSTAPYIEASSYPCKFLRHKSVATNTRLSKRSIPSNRNSIFDCVRNVFT